jgi:NAD(P)-dependent dehydrogenase (short-subunit alcohol dehydrogenase family)
MTEAFGATSTTEDVLSSIDRRGKRILVTGVSAGIGVETARSLAAHGANVIGTARDSAKVEAARARATNSSNLESVRRESTTLRPRCGDRAHRRVHRRSSRPKQFRAPPASAPTYAFRCCPPSAF